MKTLRNALFPSKAKRLSVSTSTPADPSSAPSSPIHPVSPVSPVSLNGPSPKYFASSPSSPCASSPPESPTPDGSSNASPSSSPSSPKAARKAGMKAAMSSGSLPLGGTSPANLPPSSCHELRPRTSSSSSLASRVLHQEGWLELRIGADCFNQNTPTSGEVDQEQQQHQPRRYWFQLMGGFLSWSVQEEQGSGPKRWAGRVDLRNDLMSVSGMNRDEGTGLFFFVVTTSATVNQRMVEDISDGNTSFVKSSVKQVVETTQYVLCGKDEATLQQWRDNVFHSMKRRTASTAAEMMISRRSATSADFSTSRPTSPTSRPASPGPRPLSRPASPAGRPMSPAPTIAPAPGGFHDPRSRIIKQQGFLNLRITTEHSGHTNTTEHEYWFELVGGYLIWYQNKEHAGLGHSTGKIEIKAGNAEVGELVEEAGGYYFTMATTEQIIRTEEDLGVDSEDHSVVKKTSLKKEKTTFTLSSTQKQDLEAWRQQVSAMAKRRSASIR